MTNRINISPFVPTGPLQELGEAVFKRLMYNLIGEANITSRVCRHSGPRKRFNFFANSQAMLGTIGEVPVIEGVIAPAHQLLQSLDPNKFREKWAGWTPCNISKSILFTDEEGKLRRYDNYCHD